MASHWAAGCGTDVVSRSMTLRRLVLAVCAVAALCPTGSAQSSFTFRVVATGLSSPWEVTWGPDGQLWVSERIGRRVVRIDPATGVVKPAVTIDDSYDPGTTWHEGLMGLALHPDLMKGVGRDYVYVAYTYDADPGPDMA